MDDDRETRDATAADEGDYGYDLAHEATVGADADAAPHERENVQVDAPIDADGDYGYDMAHDMRSS